MLKATVIINRHIVAANKKAGEDNAAISIRTYLGTVYAKEVEFLGYCKLIQDAANAQCTGATIWLEAKLEEMVIDGVPGSREMFTEKEVEAVLSK